MIPDSISSSDQLRYSNTNGTYTGSLALSNDSNGIYPRNRRNRRAENNAFVLLTTSKNLVISINLAENAGTRYAWADLHGATLSHVPSCDRLRHDLGPFTRARHFHFLCLVSIICKRRKMKRKVTKVRC